jgi:hypothetical protein
MRGLRGYGLRRERQREGLAVVPVIKLVGIVFAEWVTGLAAEDVLG